MAIVWVTDSDRQRMRQEERQMVEEQQVLAEITRRYARVVEGRGMSAEELARLERLTALRSLPVHRS
jgi:hypothetical protein